MKEVETARQKVIKRFRQIANAKGITYAEVQKVFNSQFEFAKEKLEELDEEYLKNASKEELEKHVFNFIYLGKIHSGIRIQKNNKKRNGRAQDEHRTDQ